MTLHQSTPNDWGSFFIFAYIHSFPHQHSKHLTVYYNEIKTKTVRILKDYRHDLNMWSLRFDFGSLEALVSFWGLFRPLEALVSLWRHFQPLEVLMSLWRH